MDHLDVIVIAEAGVNHNGDFELVEPLIRAASEAGADYVKFQTFRAESLVLPGASKAAYQERNTGDAEDQLQMLKKLELSEAQFRIIDERCRERGIGFLSTGFDPAGLDFIAGLRPDFIKIPSGELTNRPYLEHAGTLGRRVIMSTGMATLGEVEEALDVLLEAGLDRKEVIVLHCHTDYPTSYEDVHLRGMELLRERLGVTVGYSDHTLGIEVPLAAVALGAVCIEKHFTLDREMPGPDHAASLEPGELKNMVEGIRRVEKALGRKRKEPTERELANRAIARKGVHLVRPLRAGTALEAEHVRICRPESGLSPMRLPQILGKRLTRDLPEHHALAEEDLE